MKLTEARIEGEHKNLIVEFPPVGGRCLVTLVDPETGRPTEGPHEVAIADDDAAWDAAHNAYLICEGREADDDFAVQLYHRVFAECLRHTY